MRIAVLGPGEAGGEVARDLLAAGADGCGYDPRTGLPQGVVLPDGVASRVEADAVRDADLVLSAGADQLTALGVRPRMAAAARDLLTDLRDAPPAGPDPRAALDVSA